MKKIGFIDFFLDEWHANNYPGWIRNNCASFGRNCDVAYAWADTDKQGELDSAAWCTLNEVKLLSSIEEVVEKSDYVIVLSPDNPEHHERLSYIPLMSGKPVYIDKTFSSDLSSGVRMFELASKYNTPMFSSSALRFAKEISGYPDSKVNPETIEYVATLGAGHFDNYSVHQLEMIVALMGTGAGRVKSLGTDNGRLLIIEYEDGRRSSLLQMPQAPFQVSLQLNNGDGIFLNQCSEIFPRFIHAMLDFFETRYVPVPKEQTLEIIAIREAGIKALRDYDTWIKVVKP